MIGAYHQRPVYVRRRNNNFKFFRTAQIIFPFLTDLMVRISGILTQLNSELRVCIFFWCGRKQVLHQRACQSVRLWHLHYRIFVIFYVVKICVDETPSGLESNNNYRSFTGRNSRLCDCTQNSSRQILSPNKAKLTKQHFRKKITKSFLLSLTDW